jgi:biotin carboxyl carrier protein
MSATNGSPPSGDTVVIDGVAHPVLGVEVAAKPVAPSVWSAIIGTRSVEVILDPRTADALTDGEEVEAYVDGEICRLRFDEARRRAAFEATAGASGRHHAVDVVAPMPGRIVSIKVAVGDTVVRGDTVAVIEAMKMESMIIAPHSGEVVAVHVAPGTVVATRRALLRIDG